MTTDYYASEALYYVTGAEMLQWLFVSILFVVCVR